MQCSRSQGTPTVWMSCVIQSLWDLLFNLWVDRNNKLHSIPTSRSCNIPLVGHTRSSFPRAVACRFIPLRELLIRPLSSLQAWLAAYDTYYSMYTGRSPGTLRDTRRRYSNLDSQLRILSSNGSNAKHAMLVLSHLCVTTGFILGAVLIITHRIGI